MVIMVGMLATYGYEQCTLGESCETQTSQFPIFKCGPYSIDATTLLILEEVHNSSDTA
jgi:hypothetical protein